MNRTSAAAAILVACAVYGPVWAEAPKDDIDQFLIDMGSGPVSAADIIGISASAITTIESPKDLIAAVNATSTADSKAAIAFAITPARTSIVPLSIKSYSTKSNYLARVWGATAFSYAQNTNTIDGVDYKQNSAAVQISYYLDPNDDPAVAAYNSFIDCPRLRTEIDLEDQKVQDALANAQKEKGSRLTKLERDAVMNDLRRDLRDNLAKANQEAKACALKGFQDAKKKWNSSQIAATFGAGWIKGPEAGSPRLSLGRILTVAGAFGLNEQSLLNLTFRRTSHEVDLTTLATAPAYKDSNLAAARFTYGYGDARDLYALAEVSNARSATTTLSNAAFKYAIGIDKRLSDTFGLWVEFRLGRNRTIDGTTEQTAALLNFKLSPTSTLPKAAATQ